MLANGLTVLIRILHGFLHLMIQFHSINFLLLFISRKNNNTHTRDFYVHLSGFKRAGCGRTWWSSWPTLIKIIEVIKRKNIFLKVMISSFDGYLVETLDSLIGNGKKMKEQQKIYLNSINHGFLYHRIFWANEIKNKIHIFF